AQVRVLVRERLEVRVRRLDEAPELPVHAVQLVRDQAEVVDDVADVLAPRGERSRDLRERAIGRLEALERLAQVDDRLTGMSRPVRERLAAGTEQDLEVRARIG